MAAGYQEKSWKTNQSQRDSAIEQVKDAKARAETLSKQLKEKAKEISEYEQWVKELQATIEDVGYIYSYADRKAELTFAKSIIYVIL